MPRYEPKRNAEPLLKPGVTLKMRRGPDGTFKPVPADEAPAVAAERPDGQAAAEREGEDRPDTGR
jgi:hypothetical protein